MVCQPQNYHTFKNLDQTRHVDRAAATHNTILRTHKLNPDRVRRRGRPIENTELVCGLWTDKNGRKERSTEWKGRLGNQVKPIVWWSIRRSTTYQEPYDTGIH